MRIRTLHLGSMAPLVHHFVPLMMYESPCLYKEKCEHNFKFQELPVEKLKMTFGIFFTGLE